MTPGEGQYGLTKKLSDCKKKKKKRFTWPIGSVFRLFNNPLLPLCPSNLRVIGILKLLPAVYFPWTVHNSTCGISGKQCSPYGSRSCHPLCLYSFSNTLASGITHVRQTSVSTPGECLEQSFWGYIKPRSVNSESAPQSQQHSLLGWHNECRGGAGGAVVPWVDLFQGLVS